MLVIIKIFLNINLQKVLVRIEGDLDEDQVETDQVEIDLMEEEEINPIADQDEEDPTTDQEEDPAIDQKDLAEVDLVINQDLKENDLIDQSLQIQEKVQMVEDEVLKNQDLAKHIKVLIDEINQVVDQDLGLISEDQDKSNIRDIPKN